MIKEELHPILQTSMERFRQKQILEKVNIEEAFEEAINIELKSKLPEYKPIPEEMKPAPKRGFLSSIKSILP